MSLSKGLYVILIASFLVLVCAYGLQAVQRAQRMARVTRCASNLRALWQTQLQYQAWVCPYGPLSPKRGHEFWHQWKRVHPSANDFDCPLSEEGRRIGLSYRGPCRDANRLKPDDPVGADREGNHGPGQGGNVLLKSGDVREVSESDPLWVRARETTMD